MPDIEYEYGIFYRSAGNTWVMAGGRPHVDLESAQAALPRFQIQYPEDHYKIRKRAVGGWEDLED